MPPAVGPPALKVCEASVTGALAAGMPAPPAQLGGTDSAPIDDPPPAEARIGAAPMAPTPPTGATLPARAEPRPPMSAPAVAGPDSAVSRPPPPRPMRSEPADAQLPMLMLTKLPMLLLSWPSRPVGSVSVELMPVIQSVRLVIASAG